MVIFEYPFKDFLALDRAVGTGELQGVLAWALSYRRFPIIDLVVRMIGPEDARVELRLLAGPNLIATVLPFDVGSWDELDRDTRETLEFYARPDAERDIASRWSARGESSNDLEATRAAWDYLAFQYLSTWERDEDGSDEPGRVIDSLAPAEPRASFAPKATGADIEVVDASHSICLLASSAVEHAAVGRAVFSVEAETRSAITRWTVVDVDADHQLLVVRELRKRGDASARPAGPLIAWFAPLWVRDARRLLEDAEEVAEVDCLLGAGLREPLVGGGGSIAPRPVRGRGREVDLASVPKALLTRAPAIAQAIAQAVRTAVRSLSASPIDSDSGVPAGFDADAFSARRAARVFAHAETPDDSSSPCGYRLAGPIRCHGVERLLILEWTVPPSNNAETLLEDGAGLLRAYLVASIHAADEIAALRSLQGAFELDHPR